MLVVPEDREDPQGRSLRLAVAVFHPDGGAISPDPIIYLSGGPGGSALLQLYLTFDVGFAPLLDAGHDLVIFDQRGVGFSEPELDCDLARDLGFELLDGEMDGQQLTDEQIEQAFEDEYRSCAQELSKVANLGMYNTVASAADVNDLRLALGYEQVNLVGTSYGTRLALGVMRDHPQGLRSVVLDSVYPPDEDLYGDSPDNLERALTLLFNTCEADAACARDYPNLRGLFFETLAALDEEPIRILPTNQMNGRVYPMLLDGQSFFSLVYQLLYVTEALPLLPRLILEASQGEMELIRNIYGSLLTMSFISSRGMSLSVQCNEEIPFSSMEMFELELLEHPDLAPYLRDTNLGEFGYQVCSYWDSGQSTEQENEPISSQVPTLILQGEFDPVTPPNWSQHAAETLPNSYYFLFPNVAHGAMNNPCASGIVSAFLQAPGIAPDAACLGEMNALTFYPPEQ